MSIKSFENGRVVYTTEDDIYSELINPLLKVSSKYIRGVAYFHCEWLVLAADGLDTFFDNGGKMYLLTSIAIEPEEYEALKQGHSARLNQILKSEIIDRLNQNYKKDKQWALDYLSYLILTNKLEVRVAVHKTRNISIYHDKLAFFQDESAYIVCVHGSLNDSLNALSNHESIDVFFQGNSRDKERISSHREIFMRSWDGDRTSFQTLRLPELIKENLIALGNPDQDALKNRGVIRKPRKSTFIIRDYQQDAVEALRNNDWNGILEMATGTGKTLTSLFAVEKYIETNNKKVLVITAPQVHLIYQWKKNVQLVFPNDKVIICAENKVKWSSRLFREVKKYGKIPYNLILLTSYNTLTDETFTNATKLLRDDIIYIFDECHVLGASKIMNRFKPSPGCNKIGLSATPSRWLDSSGNKFIKDTIGKTVFEYSLQKAIENGKLTPYEYHPHLVELTLDEFNEYVSLTKQIGQVMAKSENNSSYAQRRDTLLRARSNLSKKAENKLECFLETFEDGPMRNAIVYVYNEQVDKMVDFLRNKYNLKVHGITANTPINSRNKILEGFNAGNIDILVAIKCLDEGIDIENCTHAYVLASSTNPREFIQRRGRVLRIADNKNRAVIHDFITIAPEGYGFEVEEKQAVVRRELPRVAEFARAAMNKPDNDKVIVNYSLELNILDEYIKHEPWDINNRVNKVENIEREDNHE